MNNIYEVIDTATDKIIYTWRNSLINENGMKIFPIMNAISKIYGLTPVSQANSVSTIDIADESKTMIYVVMIKENTPHVEMTYNREGGKNYYVFFPYRKAIEEMHDVKELCECLSVFYRDFLALENNHISRELNRVYEYIQISNMLRGLLSYSNEVEEEFGKYCEDMYDTVVSVREYLRTLSTGTKWQPFQYGYAYEHFIFN